MSEDRIVNKKQNILIVVVFILLAVIICLASFGMTAIFRNAANANIEENAKDILVVIYCFENNIDLDVLLSEARNAFERFAAAENIDSWII
jgi:flagellar basal body-associated protein FliL